MELFFAIAGFLMASYSIVANDAIQTLGTFLSSNSKRPWWVLWIFACSVLTAVFLIGWFAGDLSYGRLELIPFPTPFTWIYLVPLLVLLLLTNFGIPVSTTFLILTVFAPQALDSMLLKSLLGYVVAFLLGIIVYKGLTQNLEKDFLATANTDPPLYWVVLQWMSTTFLWSQWLIHDLANIFAYLPRNLDVVWLFFSLFVMLALHGIIFYGNGGEIQKIVTSKTNIQDIRSATIVDFLYGLILLLFKELSKIPMSTTWVFLGLLAGRELAMTIAFETRSLNETGRMILTDVLKAFAGLVISIILAFALPFIAKAIG